MKKVQKKKKQVLKPEPKPAAGEHRATGMRTYMANRLMQNGGY